MDKSQERTAVYASASDPKLISAPPALPPPPWPPPWGMTQAGRGNKSSACQTTSCPDSSLPKLHPPRGEALLMVGDKSPDWDIFKTTLTKNNQKLNTTGVFLLVLLHCCFHWYFSIKSNVAQHQPKKSLLPKLFPSIFITARFIWHHFCFVFYKKQISI